VYGGIEIITYKTIKSGGYAEVEIKKQGLYEAKKEQQEKRRYYMENNKVRSREEI